jgi:hypothetical protein
LTRRRLNAREAAEALGISVDAVRMRVRRGTLEGEHDANGRLYVWLDTDEPQPDSSPLISELRAHNATLREQLQAERQANEENRRIIAALTQRIPAIEAPSETPGSPESGAEGQERAEPRSSTGGTQELRERRSWWREFFGFD